MRRQRLLIGVGALALVFGVLIGLQFAAADPPVQHGISFTKGCDSPTKIGSPYACTFTIRNTVDDAHDTLTFNGISDVVAASGGNVTAANEFADLQYEIGPFLLGFSTPPFCTG